MRSKVHTRSYVNVFSFLFILREYRSCMCLHQYIVCDALLCCDCAPLQHWYLKHYSKDWMAMKLLKIPTTYQVKRTGAITSLVRTLRSTHNLVEETSDASQNLSAGHSEPVILDPQPVEESNKSKKPQVNGNLLNLLSLILLRE